MLYAVITIAFLLLYAGIIFYYWSQWLEVDTYKSEDTRPLPFVSVVVAARNEERNLPRLLADLAMQDVPQSTFEVIIVNDFSADGTAEIASSAAANVRMILPACEPEHSSKKAAIASGISEAKGELIVVTDADCRVSSRWLRTIAGFYQSRNAIFVAAPVRFQHDGSLLQVFQAIDFMTLQGITAATVHSGFHNMCNGANLAYTKQAFIDVNGFEGIDNVATGDDMLLMHKIAQRHPGRIFYLKNEDAIVRTRPMLSWGDFIMQRRRWASKSLVYRDYKMIAVLAFVYFFNTWFFVLIVLAFLNSIYWGYAAAYVFLKMLIEWPFVHSVAKFYKEQKLMKYFPLFQPMHIFYTVFVGFISQFGKYEWKGRKTR